MGAEPGLQPQSLPLPCWAPRAPLCPCSRVGLRLEEKTSSLLQACFHSIFYQHPQEDTQDPEASLYSKVCHRVNHGEIPCPRVPSWAPQGHGRPPLASRAAPKTLSPSQTMAVMDSMLKVLVCSAGMLGILELQNILQVWPWHRVPMGSDPRLERWPSQRLVQGMGQAMSLLPRHAPPTSPLPPGCCQSPFFSCHSSPHLCSRACCPSCPTLPPRQTCLSGLARGAQPWGSPPPALPRHISQSPHHRSPGSWSPQSLGVPGWGVQGRCLRGEEWKAAEAAAGAGCGDLPGRSRLLREARRTHAPSQALPRSKPACAVLRHATSLAHQQLFSSQVLLPFTRSQREAVQERAVAQIASLIEFTTCSMPQVPSSWSGQSHCPVPAARSPGTSWGSWAPSQQEAGSRSLCPVPALSTLSPRAGQGRAAAGTGRNLASLLRPGARLLWEQLGLTL